MNKQELITNGYKYIATQNSETKIELWAKFNGYMDMITYLYYFPEADIALKQSERQISYTQLDMMAKMRDKMKEDFTKKDLKYNKEDIWE